MLCAQHALNNVLQGHFFDASQLGQIADELNAFEQNELGLAQHTGDFASRHMDDTGYFSVEVLDRAFKTWDMSLLRWRRHERLAGRYEHPEKEFAFVLNLGSHWLAIRSFGTELRKWYNLNSFFDKPQWLGDAYLGTFLQTAEQEGYFVFTVQLEGSNIPPENIADDVADSLPAESASATGQHDGDDELARALQASLDEHKSQQLSANASPARRRRTEETDSELAESADALNDNLPSKRLQRSGAADSPPNEGRQRLDTIDMPASGRRRRSRAGQDVEDGTESMRGTFRRGSDHLSLGTSDADFTFEHVRRSPFLNPVAASLFDGDVQELDDEDEDFSSEPEITDIRRQSPAQARSDAINVEDDEEELQAVLAASLGQPYKLSNAARQRATDALERHKPIAAAPLPDDVERIREMRRRDQVESQQPMPTPVHEAEPSHVRDKRESSDDGTDEDEGADAARSDAEGPPSQDEIRRRRLARFA